LTACFKCLSLCTPRDSLPFPFEFSLSPKLLVPKAFIFPLIRSFKFSPPLRTLWCAQLKDSYFCPYLFPFLFALNGFLKEPLVTPLPDSNPACSFSPLLSIVFFHRNCVLFICQRRRKLIFQLRDARWLVFLRAPPSFSFVPGTNSLTRAFLQKKVRLKSSPLSCTCSPISSAALPMLVPKPPPHPHPPSKRLNWAPSRLFFEVYFFFFFPNVPLFFLEQPSPWIAVTLLLKLSREHSPCASRLPNDPLLARKRSDSSLPTRLNILIPLHWFPSTPLSPFSGCLAVLGSLKSSRVTAVKFFQVFFKKVTPPGILPFPFPPRIDSPLACTLSATVD